MRTTILFGLFLCLISTSTFAQHEADIWYFGIRNGMSFKNGAPTIINDGQINTAEACAVVSDKVTGKLLFYTDGVTVWNGSHNIVANGTGLMGGSSGTQSALIVPNPANSFEYYIFTVPDLTSGTTPTTTNMYYSLISVANPNCDMIIKNTVLASQVSEKLTGTLDCTETGYWVIAHSVNKSIFYSYHISKNGVDPTPVISTYNEPPIDHTQGCIKLNPKGSKLAIASPRAKSFLGLFDFDRSTGALTNYTLLGTPANNNLFYGISFSPDNSKLFALAKTSVGSPPYFCALFEYDVSLATPAEIRNSESMFNVRKNIAFTNSGMQLAPDGKIYIVSGNLQVVDVINSPNLMGTDCDYKDSALIFQRNCGRNLTNFMDYLFGDHKYDENLSEFVSDTIKFCLGSSKRIGADPLAGYTYVWTPTEGLDNPNISNPIATPTKDTEYTLHIKSEFGCERILKYVVRVTQMEKLQNTSIGPVCPGTEIELSTVKGDTYLWSPPDDLSSTKIQNPIARPKVSTRYKVIITKGECIDSAFVNVTVLPSFTTYAGEDKTVCLGESTQIGDDPKPDQSYFWIPPDGLSSTTVSNPIATPKGTMRYILQTKHGDCYAYDTVVVTVVNVKAVVSKDVTVCKGTPVQLSSSGGKVYSWSPSTGLSNPRIANPIATPTVSTKYRVRISNGSCIDSAFVTVNLYPSFRPNAGIDKSTCIGGSVDIGAPSEADFTYSWQPDTYLDDPTKSNPVCTPKVTTKYILTATNVNGCVGRDTVVVSIKNLSVNGGADKTVCTGAITQIGAPPEPGSTYLWQPSTFLDDSTKSNPIVTPHVTTKYILKAINSQGCVGYDTVIVNVGNNLVAKVTNDTSVCEGTSVQLTASGGSEYRWIPSTGLDNPTIENPVATLNRTTQYTVHVTSGDCNDSATVTVTVNPLPIANAGPDLSTCSGDILQLGFPPTTGYTYSWQPVSGLDDPNKSNPIVNPQETTQYFLTVTNATGCSSIDSVTVSSGNVTATVTHDTAVCLGSSIQLNASGGTSYQWYPSEGLSNPNIANPTCTPGAEIQYMVVVSSGLCVDSAYVTVGIAPFPFANAGEDNNICPREQVIIGSPGEAGYTYSWTPSTGLTDPNSSQTTASPTESTRYILKVTNHFGCESKDTVYISVNPSNERLFTLSPTKITIVPGEPFKESLSVPVGVQWWKILLKYDNLVISFDSVNQTTNGIKIETPKESNGKLSLSGTGGNGDVTMTFNTFLPQSPDTTFEITIVADTSALQPCEEIISQGNTLILSPFCGRIIRTVSSTGKNYFLSGKENGINIGVGLPGKVRIELYDYIGNLKEVLIDGNMDSGEYSLDFDLPTGVYFCRMNSGMFDNVLKVLIVE